MTILEINMEQLAQPEILENILVFGMSMLPVVELKGAIPIGVLQFGLPLWTTFLIAFLGSIVPAPFLLVFIKGLIHKLQSSKVRLFNKVSNWLMGKVHKHQDKVKKFGYLAIFIFVAIPLPGTGVWTSSLLAAMLDLRFRYAFPVIAVGNLVAGLAMLFVTHSIHGIIV